MTMIYPMGNSQVMNGLTKSFHFRTPFPEDETRHCCVRSWSLAVSPSYLPPWQTLAPPPLKNRQDAPPLSSPCQAEGNVVSSPSSLPSSTLPGFFRLRTQVETQCCKSQLMKTLNPQFLEADSWWTWTRPQQTLSLLQVGSSILCKNLKNKLKV